MSYTDLIQKIEDKKFKPIYFLCGEESYFIDAVMNAIDDHALDESQKAFNQITLYGKEVNGKQLLDHLRRYPVMADRQVVFMKEAHAFKDWDHLQTYFEKPNPMTVLGIGYKARMPDKRKKWVKALTKSSHTEILESKPVYDNKVPAWIADYVTKHKFKIQPEATRLLAAYLGNTLSNVANELDKLMILLNKGSTITLEDVENNIGISKKYNVFELQKALGERNASKTNVILKNLIGQFHKQPILMLVPNLHGFFQKVYAFNSVSRLSDQDIARALNIYSHYFVKDYRAAAKKYSNRQLEKIFDLFHIYDGRLKGIDGSRQSEEAIFTELVQRILYI